MALSVVARQTVVRQRGVESVWCQSEWRSIPLSSPSTSEQKLLPPLCTRTKDLSCVHLASGTRQRSLLLRRSPCLRVVASSSGSPPPRPFVRHRPPPHRLRTACQPPPCRFRDPLRDAGHLRTTSATPARRRPPPHRFHPPHAFAQRSLY